MNKKQYINPQTIILNVATEQHLAAGSPLPIIPGGSPVPGGSALSKEDGYLDHYDWAEEDENDGTDMKDDYLW